MLGWQLMQVQILVRNIIIRSTRCLSSIVTALYQFWAQYNLTPNITSENLKTNFTNDVIRFSEWKINKISFCHPKISRIFLKYSKISAPITSMLVMFTEAWPYWVKKYQNISYRNYIKASAARNIFLKYPLLRCNVNLPSKL